MNKFSTAEACKAIGVSRRTFIRWIREFSVEREVVYGENGRTFLYTREALEHLLRKARADAANSEEPTLPGAPSVGGATAQPAHPEHDEPRADTPPGATVRPLALPPSADAKEFLDLLADVRDVVARAAASETRSTAAVEEVSAVRQQVEALGHRVDQLREVLAARLPAPSPPAPQPRVRWRACTEVALLGVVTVLAGAMVAAVARVLQINGAIVLPW